MRPSDGMAEVDRAAGEHGAVEADRAAGELGVIEADRAAGEPGAAEVDRAAGELGVVEVDRAAGELGTGEVDRAAGELGAVEVDRAAGEYGARKVTAIEGHAGEVEMETLPRRPRIMPEMCGDDADHGMPHFPVGAEREPFPCGRILARIRRIGQTQVGAQDINAGLSVLFPVICQARHGVYPGQPDGRWL